MYKNFIMTYLRFLIYLLFLSQSIMNMERSEGLADKALAQIIAYKKTLTGLSVPLDLLENILPDIPSIAPYICCIEIIMKELDYNKKWNTINTIKALSIKHNFMLIAEDNFFKESSYRQNCTWADFATVMNFEDIIALKEILLEKQIKAPRGAFVKVQQLNKIFPHTTNMMLEKIKNSQDPFIIGVMHITDINHKYSHLLKISEEKIPLNLDIEKIYSLFQYLIAFRRTDICLLSLSNPSDLNKISNLSNFYFNIYKLTNFSNTL